MIMAKILLEADKNCPQNIFQSRQWLAKIITLQYTEYWNIFLTFGANKR